jgi:hypothetical protein
MKTELGTTCMKLVKGFHFDELNRDKLILLDCLYLQRVNAIGHMIFSHEIRLERLNFLINYNSLLLYHRLAQ